MQSRAIKEVIRIIDAREKEEEYAVKKHGHKKEFVDLEARNSFQMGKVTWTQSSWIKRRHDK